MGLFFVVFIAFVTIIERFILRLTQNRTRPRTTRLYGIIQALVDRRKLFTKSWRKTSDLSIRFILIIFGFIALLIRYNYYTFIFVSRFFSIIMLRVRFFNDSSFRLLRMFRIFCLGICLDILLRISIVWSLYVYRSLSLFMKAFLFVVLIVESRRSPYDLSERESELVSRYNINYRRVRFTLLFLSETLTIIWIRVIRSIN